MGARFGQFEIERPLGVGGMAETTEAIRRGAGGFEQRVCLKRILPAFCRDAEFVRAFQNEAKLAVRLVHPHICRIYDFGNEAGTWWMSMELVEAGDLRSLFERVETLRQPLPVDLVLLLAVDLASALHHAHTFRIDGKPAAIVHRDISPSNVLIDAAGHFKLADFGIAKATGSAEGGTRTGIIKGKAAYMAPEHARGEKVDARADLWSLGVVLYEALAGRRPFRGSHDLELLMNAQNGVYEPVATAAPHTPAVLQRVVTGLLETSLERRIARAADVLELLAQSPPPANARLRLSEMCARIDGEKHKSDELALAEAPTVSGPEASTAVSTAEPTKMAADGVALAAAAAPLSAPPDARTRTAIASIPSMETRQLELQRVPTERAISIPTGVREALAVEEALRTREAAERAAAQVTPVAIEGPTATTTVVGSSRARSGETLLAKVVVASALVGLVGLGLGAWGLGAFDPDAEPAASTTHAGADVAGAGAPAAPTTVAGSPPPSAAAAPREAGGAAPTPAAREVGGAPPNAPGATAPATSGGALGRNDEADHATDGTAGHAAAGEPEPEAEPAGEEPRSAPVPAERGGGGAGAPGRTATLVIGVIGFGDVWVDGRRVATSTDHVERRVRPGRHTVAAGTDAPHETRTVEVADGESLEVLLHAR